MGTCVPEAGRAGHPGRETRRLLPAGRLVRPTRRSLAAADGGVNLSDWAAAAEQSPASSTIVVGLDVRTSGFRPARKCRMDGRRRSNVTPPAPPARSGPAVFHRHGGLASLAPDSALPRRICRACRQGAGQIPSDRDAGAGLWCGPQAEQRNGDVLPSFAGHRQQRVWSKTRHYETSHPHPPTHPPTYLLLNKQPSRHTAESADKRLWARLNFSISARLPLPVRDVSVHCSHTQLLAFRSLYHTVAHTQLIW